MRALLLVLFLALVPLAGCPQLGLTPVSQTKPTSAVQIAQAAINEANATLTAINNTIAANATQGVWTKAKAQSYLNESIRYGEQVDVAQALLGSGDVTSAQAQADLLKGLILALQRRVAQEAQ